MMRDLRQLLGLLALLSLAAGAANAADLENTIYLDLEFGRVVIELRPDLAPLHVARIKELTREGFYDGIIFHRVIPGFMAQTGDPTGTGLGGSDKPDLPAEFSTESFRRGTVGMARGSDPDSANSQFFINFVATPHLNGQFTIWGQVVDGMEHLDALAPGDPPSNPDDIVRMQVAADVEGPIPALEELLCAPLFVTDGDQVVCSVANHGRSDQAVAIEMRDGRDGALVEDVLEADLGQYEEAGIHHNVVVPEGVAQAHAMLCVVFAQRKNAVQASFARLADAAAPVDDDSGEADFEATIAPTGGEMVRCR